MKDKYSVEGKRTRRDIDRAVKYQGGFFTHGTNHDKAYHDSDGGYVAVPRHSGDLAPGTARSITKALLLLGFFFVGLACIATSLTFP